MSAEKLDSSLGRLVRKCTNNVVGIGIVPKHIAFIMDGNRRYAKRKNMSVRDGYNAGFQTLLTMLFYCYELGIQYVTAYAFSIDNFKRNPEEVEQLMDIMINKIEFLSKEESILHKYQVRIHFSGNLELLNPSVRDAAKNLASSTAAYSKIVLIICIAYTSTNEIVHAVQESWEEKRGIDLMDIEKHMYMGAVPDPDIVLRTSGENRLSNFLLWQSSRSLLMSITAL